MWSLTKTEGSSAQFDHPGRPTGLYLMRTGDQIRIITNQTTTSTWEFNDGFKILRRLDNLRWRRSFHPTIQSEPLSMSPTLWKLPIDCWGVTHCSLEPLSSQLTSCSNVFKAAWLFSVSLEISPFFTMTTFLTNVDTPSASQPSWAALASASKRKSTPLEGNFLNFLVPDLLICLYSYPILLPAEISFYKYKTDPSLQTRQRPFLCLVSNCTAHPLSPAPPPVVLSQQSRTLKVILASVLSKPQVQCTQCISYPDSWIYLAVSSVTTIPNYCTVTVLLVSWPPRLLLSHLPRL